MTNATNGTTNEDRITRYLTHRAATLDMPPSSVDAVVGRATRRHRTRRGFVAAGAAVAVGAAAVGIARMAGPAEELTAGFGQPSVVETPLHWTIVDTASGQSSSGSDAAVTEDGTVYRLSTAPGVVNPDPWRDPLTLYRSVDGAEWSPVDLPGNLWATALAGAGDELYAVGTGPATGGTGVRLARSTDGGTTWTEADLPSDVAELEAAYPGEVSAGRPAVAARGGTVVVVTTVSVSLDLSARLPGGYPVAGSWELTEEGLVVGESMCPTWTGEQSPSPTSTSTVTAVPPPSGASVPALDPNAIAQAVDEQAEECDRVDPAAGRTYTWAELGVDDELRDLMLHGRTMLHVSHDGGEFAPVELGAGSSVGASVVAADDGFTLFLDHWSPAEAREPGSHTTLAWHSNDGSAWDPAGEVSGHLLEAGVVSGRPAVATSDSAGGYTIRLGQPDGSWLAVDPRQALGQEGGFVGGVAFGPLGWVALVMPGSSAPGAPVRVVHSVDGIAMAEVPVADLVAPDQVGLLDATVTADSVLIRVTEPDDGVHGTVSPQRVVVGTPTR